MHTPFRLTWLLALLLGLTASGAALANEWKVSAAQAQSYYQPLIQRVFQTAGVAVQFDYVPAARSLALVTAGDVDAEFMRAKEGVESFKDRVVLVGPLACQTISAFRRKGDTKVTLRTPEDVSKYSVGVAIGRVAAREAAKNANHLQETTEEVLFNMLMLERFQVAVENHGVALVALRKQGIQDVEVAGPPLNVMPLFLVVQKTHAAQAAQLQKAVDQLRKSGELQKQLMGLRTQQNLPADIDRPCFADWPKP